MAEQPCPVCGAPPGHCPHWQLNEYPTGNPFPDGSRRPAASAHLDPVVNIREKYLRFVSTPEAGLTIQIDRVQGYVPTLLWLTYHPDGDQNPPAFHEVRIDLVALEEEADNPPLSAIAPSYVLENRFIRFFTLFAEAYHGIPVPMFHGQDRPYDARVITVGLPGITKQFRVCWGYRPLVNATVGLGGVGG